MHESPGGKMTAAQRRVGGKARSARFTLFISLIALTSCVKVRTSEDEVIRASYAELLREAKSEFSYSASIPASNADPNVIGKYGAVTGVTMTAWTVTKNAGAPTRSREVVARFDLAGGDYPRLGMHSGENYVFVEHTNEHGNGAVLTRAYYVVSANSSEIRYLLVDKRIDLLPNHPYTRPVALAADPNQAFVFGGCVEGSFCPTGHCSLTDAGDRY
jgi:hypothetical protein